MKKLVTYSLFAVGAAFGATLVAGCTTTATANCGDGFVDIDEGCDDGNNVNGDGCNSVCEVEAKITAHWSFKNFGGSTTSCPATFDTVAIYSQPLDDNGNDVGAAIVGDLFTCSDGLGTQNIDPGLYRVYLAVETHDGLTTWGNSASVVLDTTLDDKSLTYTLLNNGGYFFLSWDLMGETSGSRLSCASAGADTVETIATVVGQTSMLVDKFTCSDHYGATSGFAAGNYTISVDATLGNGGALGPPVNLTKTMGTNNDLVTLGRVMIPISGK